MKNNLLLCIILTTCVTTLFAQDTLTIQENAPGLCSYDGDFMTNLPDTTGAGYIDIDYGIGASLNYQITIHTDGLYSLLWRYAFAGTSRDAMLIINGTIAADTVYFPPTGKSSTWWLSAPVNVNLTAGEYNIRLEALYGDAAAHTGGLGNIDCFKIVGDSVEPSINCTSWYKVDIKSNDTAWGTVSCSPIQNYYQEDSIVTIHAYAKPGYFFESWTGDKTSNDSVFNFSVKDNVYNIARFLPVGTKMDTNIVGYATVQDDSGTTYMVFGGALGSTVEATNLSELQTFLSDSLPRVVTFSGLIIDSTNTQEIKIKSNKTLLGKGNEARLQGINLSVNQARNVIIRNIAVSYVIATGGRDGLEINGASKNILIDHCEFYSRRGDNNGDGYIDDLDKDYYDGLLDIKNGSSFITVSRSSLHDHYKACLISSGNDQYVDTVARITFHHNYFYNCGSRLPSIRFGKAHIFNNYYKNNGDAINVRMGAWVRVEKNYFEGGGDGVFFTNGGYVHLIDNFFGTSTYVTSPTCDYQVPYPYLHVLDSTQNVPAIVTNGVKVGVEDFKHIIPSQFRLHQNYPNPFNPTTAMSYQLSAVGHVSLKVFDLLGREVATLVNEKKPAGTYQVEWNAENMPSGVYFYQLTAGNLSQTKKMILIK